jgi:hypothetical protein
LILLLPVFPVVPFPFFGVFRSSFPQKRFPDAKFLSGFPGDFPLNSPRATDRPRWEHANVYRQ